MCLSVHIIHSVLNVALTEWVHKWERNGWKTSTGDDVKNREDMEKLLCACKKIDVKWVSVFTCIYNVLRTYGAIFMF